MKPLYLNNILNYEYPVTAINALTNQDCSEQGKDPSDLCRDFYAWRSNTKDQIDIYFEISEADSLTTFAVIGSNLSNKASVYISASNTSGIGGFYSPLYTKSFNRRNNHWICHSSTPLPAAKYYKMTIVENGNPEINYVEITRILCGIAEEFPFELLSGFTKGNESHQKREIQEGQWRQGSENSMLDMLDLSFRGAFGNRQVKNNEYDKIYDMNAFLEDVKTSKPFLLILNPAIPQMMFSYMTIDGDSIDIDYQENGTTFYTINCKELK